MDMWKKNKVVSKPEDVMKVVHEFTPMFQGCRLEAESLVTYSKLLQDLPLKNIRIAFEYLTTQTKFFPTVAEVREIAEQLIWDSNFKEKLMGE